MNIGKLLDLRRHRQPTQDQTMGMWRTGRTFSAMCYITLFSLLMALSRPVRAVPIDNGLVDSEFVKECLNNNTVDLVVMLDGSGSVGDDTFQLQKNFVAHLARRLNVSSTNSHMAVVQYAETPQLEISLNQYTNNFQLESAIQRLRYLSGATNAGQALHFALEMGFQGSRGGNVPKVVVVVTDGQSQDDVAEPSQRLRDAHVLLYAIGVTNLVNVQQLLQITGNALRVFTVESFDQLDKSLADSLTWDMCKTEFRPGTPDIICAPDKIGVRASTKKPFDGYVFVADHFHQEECRAGPEHFPDSKSIGITVPFNNCNVHRYRSLNPRGIFVEVTIVFMFHSVFMTKVDQMVKVQCFYMEAEKSATVPLEVSMITTQFRQQIYQMPRCEYTLRKDYPNGPVVQFATLGQSVYHRWECIEGEEGNVEKDLFGMLVHSCYVDNGFGDRVDILDENGCGLDAVLLSTPDYDSSLKLATKAYHVFKYADRPVLQFQCQVTLCIKLDGGCVGITPPKCPETKPLHLHQLGPGFTGGGGVGGSALKRNRLALRRRTRAEKQQSRRWDKDPSLSSMDVFTRPIMIVDEQFSDIAECPLKSEGNNGAKQSSSSCANPPEDGIFPLPRSTMIMVAVTAANLLISGSAVVFFALHRRFLYKIHFKTDSM